MKHRQIGSRKLSMRLIYRIAGRNEGTPLINELGGPLQIELGTEEDANETSR